MGEKRSFRDRLFRKKPKEGQTQAASGESSLVPSLLSPEATQSATSVSLAESANMNTSRRPSDEQDAVNENENENENNPEVRSAGRVVAIHGSNEAASVPAAPETNLQQEQGAEVVAPVTSLWDQAYDALKESEGELIKTYEVLLSRALLKQPDDAVDADNLIPQHDAAARRQKMDDIITLGLKHAEDKKINTTILGHEITIENAIANTAGVVSWAEDYIKDAAKDLPYASIVIVGVSLVLPLLKNPVAAEEARSTGFTYVVSQMRYYAAMEPLLVPDGTKPDLSADLADRLSQLYMSIIQFQMQGVIHLYRSRTKNFFRGTINYDNWKGKLESIKEAEKALKAKFAAALSAQSLDTLKRMRLEAEESRRQLDNTLSKMTQILQDQLSITSRMDRRMADAEDRACIESLRADDPRYDKTRIESDKGGLFEDSYSWIFDNSSFRQWQSLEAQALLWIRGDPGKGKTMLMCAIIDSLVKSASAYTSNVCYFFCQATQDRANNGSAVLRGLIYMLLKQQPSLLSYLRELHDGIGARRFEDRNSWQALAKLFEQITTDAELGETYVLIDGLDECSADLNLLLDHIVGLSSGSSRIRWIVSSRNEAPMTERLGQANGEVQLSLELNAESVSAAVSAYIDYKVDVLQSSKAYSESERTAIHSHLVKNANATFLWVSLVCQQLAGLDGWDALDEIKEDAFPPGLDDLYKRMLQRVDDAPSRRTVEICKQILAAVCTVYRPLALDELPSVVGLPEALSDNLKALEKALSRCGSFISLKERVISVVHQSAADFLLGQAADRIFPMGIKHTHHSVFVRSLQSLGDVLKQDMYQLVYPGYRAQDIDLPDPDPLVALKYCVTYWVDHLEASDVISDAVPDDVKDEMLVHGFLRTKYLYWLEALSLDCKIPEGIQALAKLQKLLSQSRVPQLSSTLLDANRFLRYFKVAIEITPLQLYASALLFSPTQSITRKNFEQHMPNCVYLQPSPRANWDSCMQTLEGHKWAIDSVQFSPDDQRVTSSSDEAIRVWDTVTGDCIHTFEVPANATTKLAFSGQRAAFGYHDSTIQIWNITTNTCVQTLQGYTGRIKSVKFSPHGERIASDYYDDPTIWIWDIATGICKLMLEGDTDTIESVAFSLDGQRIACFTNLIRIWDISTNICIKTIEGDTNWVESVAFFSDGYKIASGSHNGAIRIWNITTGTCIKLLEGHTSWVTAVVISPDGQRIASSSHDGTIRIWDTTTGICANILKGHTSTITSVAFSSDGQKLISGARDKTIRFWDLTTEISTQTSEENTETITAVRFSPNNRTIASISDKTIRIWDSRTGVCKQILIHKTRVLSVAFSWNAQKIASGSGHGGPQLGIIQIWDIMTGVCLQRLEGYADVVKSLAFSTDSQKIALCSRSSDRTIQIWDTTRGVCTQTLEGRVDRAESVVFSPDMQKIAVLSDATCRIWNTTTGFLISTLLIRTTTDASVVFSPDSQKIALGPIYSDKTIKIWDIAGEVLRILEGHIPANPEIVFSPDGNKIAATTSGTTRIWDTITCAHTLTLDGCFQPIPPAIFSLNGRLSAKEVGHLRDWIVTVCDNWVFVNGSAALWLPSEYRTKQFAVGKSTLALGCVSGQAWFLRFTPQRQ